MYSRNVQKNQALFSTRPISSILFSPFSYLPSCSKASRKWMPSMIIISIFFSLFCMGESSEQGHGGEHGFVEGRIKQRFQILRKIGSGAYGHVWKVRCRETKSVFALKKVFLAFQDETDAQRVYRQISLLRKLKSNLVVRLREVLACDSTTDIYLLFDYMESDIFQAIKNRVLDPTHKKFIVYQLACGLKYLHSAGVVHRDLKPSNVLINSNCDVKLCDFGLSRSLVSEYFSRPIMTEFIATRWYRSPEVLLGSRSYSTKSDMWSLGCLIYELYSRRTLLPGENTIDQITKILEFKGKPTPQEIESFKSPKSTEILTYFKVQQHPIEQYYDDLENQEIGTVLDHLFEYDQNKRWSAEELLNCDFLKEFKGVLPESVSRTQVSLELNDNRKYSVDRYKSEILGFAEGGERERPKQRPSKRLHLSQRTTHKSNYSLHSNLSKFAKPAPTSLRPDAKRKLYQSTHVSPNPDRSIDRMASRSRKNILKASERLTVETMHKRRDSNEEEKVGKKNDFMVVVSKSKSKKYLKPERVIKQPGTSIRQKENLDRPKMLKREKLRPYHSGLQA